MLAKKASEALEVQLYAAIAFFLAINRTVRTLQSRCSPVLRDKVTWNYTRVSSFPINRRYAQTSTTAVRSGAERRGVSYGVRIIPGSTSKKLIVHRKSTALFRKTVKKSPYWR